MAVFSFSIESMMRGYHVCKDIWAATIGEELNCSCEASNASDPFAVAVAKSGITVGHVSRKISAICNVFLRRHGTNIKCCVTFSPLLG